MFLGRIDVDPLDFYHGQVVIRKLKLQIIKGNSSHIIKLFINTNSHVSNVDSFDHSDKCIQLK